VAVQLAINGYRVVVPDLRGHGKSGWTPPNTNYHLSDMVNDMNQLVHAEYKQMDILAGHSFGSILAICLAALHHQSIRHLILVEPPGFSAQPRSALNLLQSISITNEMPHTHRIFSTPNEAAEYMKRVTTSLTMEQAIHLSQRVLQKKDDGYTWIWDPRLRSRTSIHLGVRAFFPNGYHDILQSISSKITLIFGTDINPKRFNDWNQLANDLGLQILQLPGGHNLHLESPNELAACMLECVKT
jgi:pimeloyl-ACP methyl ester carboxylesterase